MTEITLLFLSFPFSVAALNFPTNLFSKSNNAVFDSSEISFFLITLFLFFSLLSSYSSYTDLSFFNCFLFCFVAPSLNPCSVPYDFNSFSNSFSFFYRNGFFVLPRNKVCMCQACVKLQYWRQKLTTNSK